MIPRDFTARRHFPGTESSHFDWAVRAGDLIAHLPRPIFAALLFLLALIPTVGEWPRALVLWLFFLGDWAMLAALPRAHKSFGPPQPPVLLLAALRLIPGAFPFPIDIASQVLGTLLVVYGFWIEPHRIGTTRQALRSPKLRALDAAGNPIRPFRVLHLADLHIERTTERERRLLLLVQQCQPDLILFSGDFLSLSTVADPVAWEQARRFLAQLHAPYGVMAVTGSPPVDRPSVVARLLTGLDIRWLRDERVTLHYAGQPIDVIGITCTHKPFVDAPRLDAVLADRPEHFTILLYHSPDLAPEAARRGIDLQLSGHTHGGQVRLPFFGALYTASLYGKRFEAGRCVIGPMTLYVSRGIGMEGMGAPRVRFLCPPEIILWEISGV